MRHGTDDFRRRKLLFRLSGCVHFRDDDLIGIFERTGKIEEERFGARIGVWLPDCPNARLWETCSRACQRGLDFRWMVSIVIKNLDIVDHTAQLESSARTCKLTERLRRFFAGES